MKKKTFHLFSWAIFLSMFLLNPLSLEAGIKAPNFEAKDVFGVSHKLSDYKGKVVVLYFWATWCPGCVRDTDNINKAYAKYQTQGVEFLGVSLDQNQEKLKDYIEKKKIKFPVIFEGKAWDHPLVELYTVSSTPSFFIISPEGELWGSGHWGKELSSWLSRLS